MSFLTLLPEVKRKPIAEANRSSATKAKALREKVARNVVQIENEALEAVTFS